MDAPVSKTPVLYAVTMRPRSPAFVVTFLALATAACAIVEGDAALVALLQHAMETRSLRVATFADGETAAAALTGASPEIQASVILLGVDIPALNGLEVLRRLKAGEITRLSSVVMLTSRTGERDVLAALELGATDHIAKPFSVPVLMHKVRTVLKQGQSW